MASVPLDVAHHLTHVVLDLDWIEKGNQKVPEICVVMWYYDRILSLQQVFVFANSETDTVRESCIIHFPTKPRRKERRLDVAT